MGKKTAFVLAGGGAAGAYQAGCLKATEELGIKPDFIWGTSAGALNATGYSYVGMDKTLEMWRSIKRRSDVFGANLFRYLGLPFGVDGVYHSKPLRQKVSNIVMGRGPRVPIYVNVCDLNSGRLVQRRSTMHDPMDFIDWVVASASIPVLVEPVKERYVDGGVLENIPLKSVIAHGAERIFMFLNFPNEKDKRIKPKKDVSGILGITKRSIELIMNEGYWEDIRICEEMNSHPDKKKIELYVVAPDRELIGALDFDQEKIEKAINAGREDALEILTKALEGVQLD